MNKIILLAALLPFVGRHAKAEPVPEFIRKNALQIEVAGDLPDQMYAKIKDYKVIAVGEMHGTNEAPAFVLKLARLLVKKGRSPILGLEIGAADQGAIDLYLKTGKIEILNDLYLFKREVQDGRSSRAVAELLSGVRTLPGVRVVCFDPMTPTELMSWQDRDTGMARHIAAAFAGNKKNVMVVLAGNGHTALVKGSAQDKNYRPMGYELHAGAGAIFSQKDLLAILARFESGSAWNCRGNECKEWRLGQNSSSYSQAVSWPAYFLKEPELSEGHNAVFFSRTFSASAPLNP